MHRPECADALAAAPIAVADGRLYVGQTAELRSARRFYEALFQQAALRAGLDLPVRLAPLPEVVEALEWPMEAA